MRRALPLLSLLLFAFCALGRAAQALPDGDIIFQVSKVSQRLAIQRTTAWRYGHTNIATDRRSLYGSTDWHSRWSERSPPIVMPSSPGR